jgi:glycosyltransferase involved in cell wall biosynthesis
MTCHQDKLHHEKSWPANITVLELYVHGLEHVPINSEILELASTAFPHSCLSFRGEKSHLNGIQDFIDGRLRQSIEFELVEIPSRKARPLIRLIYLLKNSIRLIKCLMNQPGIIVVACATSSELNYFSILSILRMIRSPILAVLHSSANEVTGYRSRNPLTRKLQMRSSLEQFCRLGNSCIVLEKSICANLVKELPSLKHRIFTLPHPVAAPVNVECTENDTARSPVFFGFLGVSSKDKGFDRFCEAAKDVKLKYPGKALFHTIGKLATDSGDIDTSFLDLKPLENFLDRAQYEEQLKRLDYCIFPYKADSYRLTASGAILDAVAWLKPVICSKTALTESLFKEYGDIGYMYDLNSSLTDTLLEVILEQNERRYAQQVDNLKRFRDSRQIASLTEVFFEIVEAQKPERSGGM